MPDLTRLLDEASLECEELPIPRMCNNITGWKSLAYMNGEHEPKGHG